MFDIFENRITITATLKTTTAIHIGASGQEFSPSSVKSPLLRDSLGQPYIPGSSLKGIMRAFMEKILRADRNKKYGNGKEVCTITHMCCDNEVIKKEIERIKDSKSKTLDEELAKYVYDNTCIVCKIFGSNENGSKLLMILKRGSSASS